MFFVQLTDISRFLSFSLNIFCSFFLPNFGLNLISSNFFLLSNLLILYLLHKIILCSNSLPMKFSSSGFFIFHFPVPHFLFPFHLNHCPYRISLLQCSPLPLHSLISLFFYIPFGSTFPNRSLIYYSRYPNEFH